MAIDLKTSNMKILHTISSIGVKSGGTSSCLYNMLLDIKKYSARVLCFRLGSDDKLPGEGLNIEFVEQPSEKRFLYSKQYKSALIDSDAVLFHIHGIWQYVEYIAAKVARKKNIPYIICPHGMLYPEALNKSRIMKNLFLSLFLKRDLQKAASVHVTCEEEMAHIRNLGIKSPIAVIPNSVEIPQSINREIPNKKRIGYLGRIHPRKNIDKIIHAWNRIGVNDDEHELLIIGSGDDMYFNFLKEEVSRLNLRNVVFTGFLSGMEKQEALDSLNYLIVPSDFENFGMIIAEALSRKIPVIASKGTPWKDLEDYQCGWWIENDIDSIAQTIEECLSLTEEEWLKMGENGRRLVVEKYSTTTIADKLENLYDWILKKKEKPDFVYL